MAMASPVDVGSEAREGRRLLERYLQETESRAAVAYFGVRPEEFESGRAILAASPEAQVVIVQAALATLAPWRTAAGRFVTHSGNVQSGLAQLSEVVDKLRAAAEQREQGIQPPAEPVEPWGPLAIAFPDGMVGSWRLGGLLSALTRRRLPYSNDDLVRVLDGLAALDTWDAFPARGIVRSVERRIGEIGMAPEVREALARARASVERQWHTAAESRKVAAQIEALLVADQPKEVEIDPADDWGAAAREALAHMDAADRPGWLALLEHAATATASKPSGTWQKEARRRIHALGEERFKALATAWMGLLKAPTLGTARRENEWTPVPSSVFTERNATLLKGIVCCCVGFDDEDLARAVAEAAEGAFKKIPEFGARSTRAGNACLYVLGAMPGPHGAPQLVRLQRQLKQPSARGRLDSTLDNAAAQAGVTRDDLEDQAVPTHGLHAGPLRAVVGPYTAEVVVRGPRQVTLQWSGPDGAALAAEPADVRKAHAATYKLVTRLADEVRQTLLAQRDRLERVLLTERCWRLADWQRLYLDHALLSLLTRKLIWSFTEGERTALGAWHDGRLVDVADAPLDWLTDATEVRLWHPITAPAETVLAWRRWLARHEVTQPFKQAHREVYLLTDAERAAGVESQRFAEHILRQHQFQALCRERGWRYGLQGSFDNADEAVPTLDLPRWGLRAELSVEPIEEDDMVSANAIFLYVHTDSVHFVRAPAKDGAPTRTTKAALRRDMLQAMMGGDVAGWMAKRMEEGATLLGAEPVPLAEVPPVVFSEVMRDVDLFVGVCSVGADPAWLDKAPQRYADYWSHFSFGDVAGSPSVATRRAVLEGLLPSLKIGPRCSLADRFLVVRGDLRTYKIHLGSANVLMVPDQYLCIVPTRGPASPDEAGHIYLPFEGDSVLSLVLSKAFLLANDTAIKDASIMSQIQAK
jgi:hypothetical protein